MGKIQVEFLNYMMRTYLSKINSCHILLYLLILTGLAVACKPKNKETAGIFNHRTDVGNPELKGKSIYDAETGEYTYGFL